MPTKFVSGYGTDTPYCRDPRVNFRNWIMRKIFFFLNRVLFFVTTHEHYSSTIVQQPGTDVGGGIVSRTEPGDSTDAF